MSYVLCLRVESAPLPVDTMSCACGRQSFGKRYDIQESIRRGHDDLGDHFLDCGDLGNALKCYSRSAKHNLMNYYYLDFLMHLFSGQGQGLLHFR
jgi:hypothetical protein